MVGAKGYQRFDSVLVNVSPNVAFHCPPPPPPTCPLLLQVSVAPKPIPLTGQSCSFPRSPYQPRKETARGARHAVQGRYAGMSPALMMVLVLLMMAMILSGRSSPSTLARRASRSGTPAGSSTAWVCSALSAVPEDPLTSPTEHGITPEGFVSFGQARYLNVVRVSRSVSDHPSCTPYDYVVLVCDTFVSCGCEKYLSRR